MNRTLRVFPFDGINTDSLGHYLAGLGLLAATARRWPAIRACWQGGRFMLLSDQIATAYEIKQYLLASGSPRRTTGGGEAQKANEGAREYLEGQ